MIKQINKKKIRDKKHRRIRSKINGTNKCPRLCVFRSSKNIYAQVIDDIKGHTITSASSLELKDINGSDINGAEEVGKLLAEKACKIGIKDVVFDRGGYIYHGRIKALANGAREGGLKF